MPYVLSSHACSSLANLRIVMMRDLSTHNRSFYSVSKRTILNFTSRSRDVLSPGSWRAPLADLSFGVPPKLALKEAEDGVITYRAVVTPRFHGRP